MTTTQKVTLNYTRIILFILLVVGIVVGAIYVLSDNTPEVKTPVKTDNLSQVSNHVSKEGIMQPTPVVTVNRNTRVITSNRNQTTMIPQAINSSKHNMTQPTMTPHLKQTERIKQMNKNATTLKVTS
jgi:hypothetical protein